MNDSIRLRLICDPPRDGPANMARDEALLESIGESDAPPTLRFYGWSSPTVSLGYFQRFDDFLAAGPPICDLAVVRRTTGGGAILHDLEITYSLVVPTNHPWLRPNANALYERAHRAVMAAVGHSARPCGDALRSESAETCDMEDSPPASHGRRGPFFCFARRHALDVIVTDPTGIDGVSKLAGSAQRRTRSATLQHGSILFGSRFVQQPAATWAGLGGPTTFDDAAERLQRSFETVLDAELTVGQLSSRELNRAIELEFKYADPTWTRRR